MIHKNHKMLQFLQTQTKLQQLRHTKGISYLQQFDLFNKYKKGITNKIVNSLSWTPKLEKILTNILHL